MKFWNTYRVVVTVVFGAVMAWVLWASDAEPSAPCAKSASVRCMPVIR